MLLDFGAARKVINDSVQKAPTAIVKPGYAPIEQYAEDPSMTQGPWTDLYALGGTIYFLLTGREPVPAASRALASRPGAPMLYDTSMASTTTGPVRTSGAGWSARGR